MFNYEFLIPEFIVLSLGLFSLLFRKWVTKSPFVSVFLGFVFAIIAINVFFHDMPSARILFNNTFVFDRFSLFVKMILVIFSFVAIRVSMRSIEIYPENRADFFALVFFVLLGGMILVSANHLLLSYLAIETMSLGSYVLAAIKTRDGRSTEAGIKYAIYGSISSAIMLFGISMIYAVMGDLSISFISGKILKIAPESFFVFHSALILFWVGLSYKLAVAPFHMWCPDVYEGSPLPVTLFFSVVPKFAVMGFLIRLSLSWFNVQSPHQVFWNGLLATVAMLTITIGNLTAINQKSVKRMIAYSSVSHVGFLLAVLVSFNERSINTFLLYMFSYALMVSVALAVVGEIVNHYGSDDHERFSGMAKRNPEMAVVLSIALISLAGIPPTIGFVAKFSVFLDLWEKRNSGLLWVAVINTIVSLYYYLRLVRIACVDENESNEKLRQLRLNSKVFLYLSGALLVFGGLCWDFVLGKIQLTYILFQ